MIGVGIITLLSIVTLGTFWGPDSADAFTKNKKLPFPLTERGDDDVDINLCGSCGILRPSFHYLLAPFGVNRSVSIKGQWSKDSFLFSF